MDPSDVVDLDAALFALRRAYQEAVRQMRAEPDLHAAYLIATRLAEQVREIADGAALVRAEAALCIQTAEALSVSELAAQLGLSKARAGQLVRAARRGQQTSESA
ncbi:hypothetical protein AB0B45_46545 [Nonomuraea sp. NPDC049152]|uniref:hypothetical protein n=1 Tax=Nonomuraea sp. NPDC049152 TaxID=3154350 RepID=UPI0033D7FD7D